MLRALLLSTILVAGTAQAQDAALSRARDSANADCASTFAGLALGLAEGNPIGPAVCLLKPAFLAHAAAMPEPDRTFALHATDAVWHAATVSNIVCIVGAIASAGVGAPVCIAVGAVAGAARWRAGAAEREFAVACAYHKQVFPETANLPCVFRSANS